MAESDHQLLDRYRRGQVEALEVLIEKYKRPLFAYILNMTGGRDDADEIFQEVWFRVIRKIHSYRRKNFFGWLVRIAHNLVIDRSRRRKPNVSLDEEIGDGRSGVDALEGRSEMPHMALTAGELGVHIREAVRVLPREQREVFLMRVQAELPFREIARIQRASINTVLARMHYALAKLRPLLREDYEALGRTGAKGG